MAKVLKITPKGTAQYPHLHKSDIYKGDDGRTSDPMFKVDLICPEDDAEELVGFLEGMLKDAKEQAEQDNDKYNEIFIDEDIIPFYTEDGETTFKLKLNENGENKKTGETWKNKPSIFDARGKRIAKVPAIGGGSVLKVSFEPYTWTMPESEGRGKSKVTNLKVGISLRLKAVQIIKLEQFNAASAESMGFGVEEGFAYDPNEFDDEPTPAQGSQPEGDDDEDF